MNQSFKHIKKVGLGIMGFEGSENIYNILKELEGIIDYSVVGLQPTSYHGDPIRQADINIVNSVKTEGLLDSIIWITTDTNKPAREQEADKRNFIMEDMEKNGCSHVIVIDADEYYNRDSFLNALFTIDENNYDITYCQYTNYYKDYKSFLIYPFNEGMYVPFICRSFYRFKFECTDFTKPSDPTRRVVRKKGLGGVPTDSLYVFPWKDLKMHHLSWCRISCASKLSSWSSKKLFSNHNDLIDLAIHDFEHYDENTDRVHIMFNVPGNSVKIRKTDTAYIRPARDIMFYRSFYNTEKKILVLNMNSTIADGLYMRLETACRKTWGRDIIGGRYPNIEYWNVIDHDGESHIDTNDHTVYVREDKDRGLIHNLGIRFMKAIEMLESASHHYDYIIKTNTSTWLNIKFLNELLKYQISDHLTFGFQVCSAFWSTYNLYLKGNLTIFSKRTIDYLKTINMEKYRIDGIADDVLIGSAIASRVTQLGIPQTDMLRSLPCINIYDHKIKNVINPLEYCAIQVKTPDDRSHDVSKMKSVDKLYRTFEFNSEFYVNIPEQCKLITEMPPMKVQVLRHTKKQWLEETPDSDKDQILLDLSFTEYKDWNEMSADIIKMKIAGGYSVKGL